MLSAPERARTCDVHLRLWLGYVVRYYEDGPTYAWTMARRIGGCSTNQAARSAAPGPTITEGR